MLGRQAASTYAVLPACVSMGTGSPRMLFASLIGKLACLSGRRGAGWRENHRCAAGFWAGGLDGARGCAGLAGLGLMARFRAKWSRGGSSSSQREMTVNC